MSGIITLESAILQRATGAKFGLESSALECFSRRDCTVEVLSEQNGFQVKTKDGSHTLFFYVNGADNAIPVKVSVPSRSDMKARLTKNKETGTYRLLFGLILNSKTFGAARIQMRAVLDTTQIASDTFTLLPRTSPDSRRFSTPPPMTDELDTEIKDTRKRSAPDPEMPEPKRLKVDVVAPPRVESPKRPTLDLTSTVMAPLRAAAAQTPAPAKTPAVDRGDIEPELFAILSDTGLVRVKIGANKRSMVDFLQEMGAVSMLDIPHITAQILEKNGMTEIQIRRFIDTFVSLPPLIFHI